MEEDDDNEDDGDEDGDDAEDGDPDEDAGMRLLNELESRNPTRTPRKWAGGQEAAASNKKIKKQRVLAYILIAQWFLN